MFENLPKRSAQQLEYEELLEACSPTGQALKPLLSAVSKELSQIIRSDAKLEFVQASLVSKPIFSGTLFACSWPPNNGQAWLELDIKILQQVAYRAIGQKISKEELDPMLSDLERGTVLFLLSRLLESTQDSFQIIEDEAVPTGPLHCLGFDLNLDLDEKLKSYLRIWVSRELLESLSHVASPDLQTEKKKAEKRSLFAKVPIGVSLSELEITLEELKSLEVGDILLLENEKLTLKDQTVSGPVSCEIGEPGFGILKADLQAGSSGNYELKVRELL